MKRMTWAISAAVLLAAGAGFAAEEHRPVMGPETRAEAQARAGVLFDKLDLNHDGKLDQADRAARMSGMFDKLDTNHDETISRDEFAAAQEHMMGTGRAAMSAEQPGGHAGHMGHWGYDHREMHGLVMLIMQRADPSHTGSVTRDAFVGGALSLFDAADTNHDGVLTPAEQQTYAMAMRRQMHEMHGHHGAPGDDMSAPDPADPAPGK